MSVLQIPRRGMMGNADNAFDIGDAKYWIAGSISGIGALMPGEVYYSIVLADARTDLDGMQIAYSSDYQIYAFYYNDESGSSGGSGSGWKSTNPYTLSYGARKSVRILFKPSADPNDITTKIMPHFV